MLSEHECRNLALLLGVVHSGREGQVDAAGLRGRPRLARIDELGRGLLEGAVVAMPSAPERGLHSDGIPKHFFANCTHR